MYENNVPPGVRDALLDRACSRNLPVEVSLVGRGHNSGLKSRLLQGPTVGAGRGDVIIDAPTVSGRPVSLRPDDEVQVLVMLDGERYGFHAQVLGKRNVRLSGDIEVSGVALGYPAQLVKMQRRRFFRARIPTLSPVKAKCTTTNPVPAEGATEADTLVQFESIVLDLSAGGAGLIVSERTAKLIIPGKRWVVSFELPGIADPIRLVAELRYSRQIPGAKDFIVGAQFVNWEKTVAGRRAVSDITRFVARRQRDDLKKMSGLE